MASASSLSKVLNTMSTTKKTLLRKLAASKVNFYRHSLKPILQAVYALYQIGYLKPGMLLDPVLINTIAGWWKMTGAELRETVQKEELIHDSDGLTRIDCINLLLKDVSILEISAAIKLNSQVIDLLLSSVYADAMLRGGYPISFPGSPQLITLDDFTEGFPEIFANMGPKRKIAETFEKAPECLKLVKHLSENYGGYLIPANGPMVLFHGTSLSYLPSILSSGLEAKSEELYGKVSTLFMAEEPASSYFYVERRVIESLWEPDLYSECGVLLACELSRTRKPDWDYETHPDGDVKIGRPQPIHIFGPEIPGSSK
ncbi:uncharacterized protein EAF02_010967 [Botrytis sinoallii]|uniref:uncharacterized protein n=1 Tax=Botrytis sinoallii TaxID=1463999 RepID=UPI0018FF6BA8|nr:uncharacterized protein EAF02_010967 [Botrytis sinoallii]KAF7859519.1 hypothetical protein EAF02_010967 [Botrytis sinoallii]